MLLLFRAPPSWAEYAALGTRVAPGPKAAGGRNWPVTGRPTAADGIREGWPTGAGRPARHARAQTRMHKGARQVSADAHVLPKDYTRVSALSFSAVFWPLTWHVLLLLLLNVGLTRTRVQTVTPEDDRREKAEPRRYALLTLVVDATLPRSAGACGPPKLAAAAGSV